MTLATREKVRDGDTRLGGKRGGFSSRGLRERPELPQRGPGQSAGRKQISVLSMRHRMPLVEIVYVGLCLLSLGGRAPVRPPLNTPLHRLCDLQCTSTKSPDAKCRNTILMKVNILASLYCSYTIMMPGYYD